MPIILKEEEGIKLGGRQLIMPNYLVKHLEGLRTYYNSLGGEQTKGDKRLNALLNKNYNDPEGKKGSHHNEHTISFADAKRIDFDMKNMDAKSVEYSKIGGDIMKNWLSSSLRSLRNSVKKVGKVAEVPKLSVNDVKPTKPESTVKVNGIKITVEGKSFNENIRKIF